MVDVKLPEGWIYAHISDIAFKGVQRKPSDNENFTYVDIGSIDRDLKKIVSPQQLVGKNAPSRARKVINQGDVLVSLTRPNLNAVALVSKKYDGHIASTGFEVIKILTVDSRYVFALTRSKHFIDTISGAVQGALYPSAKSSDVQSYKFPLPPLIEQKVIADKLDTLLAQVETTKAHLERIPNIIKRFRQSVLAAAASGKLTEGWRQEEFVVKRKSLSDISIDIQVGIVRSSSEQESISTQKKHIPYIKMNNIDNHWGVVLDDVVYVDCDKGELEKYHLKKGDWLFNTRNSQELVGKSCVWKRSGDFVYNNNILRVRLSDGYLPEFLEIWFRSPKGREMLEVIKSATTNVAAIYQKQLTKQLIPFPSNQEQAEIVRRVDQLFTYSEFIEAQVQASLARVNNLTQSILAKAFRGDLTANWRATNPDLISGENSAEALLAKIKAELEALAKQPKKRKPAVKKKTGEKMSKQIIHVLDALKAAGKPLSGQELLAAAGYPSDSSTELLEQFFLDVRDALDNKQTITQSRDAQEQDWFALAD